MVGMGYEIPPYLVFVQSDAHLKQRQAGGPLFAVEGIKVATPLQRGQSGITREFLSEGRKLVLADVTLPGVLGSAIS